MTQAVEWVAYVGAPLHDEDGNVVGTIEEFYVETGDHGCSVKRCPPQVTGSGRRLEPPQARLLDRQRGDRRTGGARKSIGPQVGHAVKVASSPVGRKWQ